MAFVTKKIADLMLAMNMEGVRIVPMSYQTKKLAIL